MSTWCVVALCLAVRYPFGKPLGITSLTQWNVPTLGGTLPCKIFSETKAHSQHCVHGQSFHFPNSAFAPEFQHSPGKENWCAGSWAWPKYVYFSSEKVKGQIPRSYLHTYSRGEKNTGLTMLDYIFFHLQKSVCHDETSLLPRANCRFPPEHGLWSQKLRVLNLSLAIR